MKNAICATTTHVLALIAENYQKVREGVEHIMGGKVIEYEANTHISPCRVFKSWHEVLECSKICCLQKNQ